jgi:aminomethyltransferase
MVQQATLMAAEDINHVPLQLEKSPFHARYEAINNGMQWEEWNGFASAVTLKDSHLEYFATRNTCAVFDVSPMCKYRFRGADAEDMLNRLVTRDVAKHGINRVCYNVWCDDNGRVIDDGTLFRYAKDDFMLCCAEPGLDWFLLAAVGFDDVTIEDESDQLASLALQGPTSCALLKAMNISGVENLKPFDIGRFPYGGGEIMISRTGFTGDLGYELWVEPEMALGLWDDLFSTGANYGIQPMGTEALDMARLEAGFISPMVEFHGALHTVDQGKDHSPFELGLSWIVNFKKPHFNGRAALLKEKEQGSKYRLLKLDIEGNKPAEHSILYSKANCSKAIGYVTSAMWSPVVKANIALAMVETQYAEGEIYAEVYHQQELRWQRKVCKAEVKTKPFWSPDRARLTPPADV